MNKTQRAHITRAINRFEAAVEEYAFRGTIPAGESEEADNAVAEIEWEYTHSRRLLENLIERYSL